jgi:hypothetical protein
MLAAFMCRARRRTVYALFARVELVIVMLFVRLVRAVSHRSSCVVRECHACCSHTLSCAVRVCRAPRRALLAPVARISRVDHVCRAASARDNKLFALISIHINNVNLPGLIF